MPCPTSISPSGEGARSRTVAHDRDVPVIGEGTACRAPTSGLLDSSHGGLRQGGHEPAPTSLRPSGQRSYFVTVLTNVPSFSIFASTTSPGFR